MIIKQWLETTKDSDAVIIGDMNLDFITWDNPEQNVKTMVQDMKAGIEMSGFQQMTKGTTRSWKGTKDSLLDQVWTNAPHRVLKTFNIVRGAADHNISGVVIRIKGIIRSSSEFIVRNWKKVESGRIEP